jgi:outer membrane protein assembly factor BamB
MGMRSKFWIRSSFSLLVVVGTLFVDRGQAYTYIQVGVDSNFLTEDGRVYFAQSNGSLTVLDLKTGEVILRKKDRDYSGTIISTDHGILVHNYGKITMIDRRSLIPIWQTESHYKANVTEDFLVSYDGNGLVECRHLSDGSTRWSYNLPGALDIIAEGQNVLVHRAATFEGTPTTVLLDLDTGKEVFRKQPPPNVHYGKVFFDGEKIYLETGSFTDKRSDYTCEKLTVWNISGEEIGSLSLSDVEQKFGGRLSEEPFVIDNKTFYMSRVYSQGQPVPPWRHGRGKGVRVIQNNPLEHKTVDKFDVDEGEVLITSIADLSVSLDSDSACVSTIEFKSKADNWNGVLPYLKGDGRVSVVGSSADKLLIGTNLGHVECIEKSTGCSLWMYIFPTMRHGVSFSSHGMGPTMAEAAAIFRRENKRTDPVSGMRLLNSPEPESNPRIIFDPDPTDPFEKLPLYLAIAWSAAIVPLILLSCMHISRRIRRLDPVAFALVSAVLTFILTFSFLFYGRVSFGSSIALRLSFIVVIGIGFTYSAQVYPKRKHISAILFSIFVTSLVIIFPALWPW